MNVCLVSQEYPPETARGGIGTQTWNKARSLSRLGHSVHVLTCAGAEGPNLRTDSCCGVTVHRMQPPDQEPGRQFPVYSAPAYWLGYSWTVLRQMHNLMPVATFDVIDFAEYGAEGFAYPLDRVPWNWAPVVVQLHGPLAMLARHMGWPEQDSEFCRAGSFMEGTSIRLADGLMACSANIADFTAEFYGVARESIDVVHCVVDGETGILVPPRDVDATVRALDTILSERDLRGRMGEAGRRRVEDYFAMDKYILRILTAYQRTMERSLPRLRRFQAAAGCGGE